MQRPIAAKLSPFLRNDERAPEIDYGLLASGVAGVILAVVREMATWLQGMYQSVSNGFN